VLVRLRSDRCFYADPPPAVGAKVGRPRRHGQKFTCAEERTWWTPTSEHCEEHAQYGSVRVRAWAGVHTKTHNHPAKGSNRPKAVVRGTLVLVEVERLPRQTRIPKRLWLWWRGPGQPDLAVLWRAYAATRKSLKLSVGTIQPGHPLGLTPSRACAGSNPGVRSHEKRRRCGSHHTHSVTGVRVAARGSRERESVSKRLPKPRDRHTGCKVTAQVAIYANRSQPQPRRQQARDPKRRQGPQRMQCLPWQRSFPTLCTSHFWRNSVNLMGCPACGCIACRTSLDESLTRKGSSPRRQRNREEAKAGL
jgi:hypothetical protein